MNQICQIPILRCGEDIPRWKLHPQGEFSVASAWASLREQHRIQPLLGAFWNELLTPTISIFLWRLLQNKLPVDSKLQQKGISLASKCLCCQPLNPTASPWHSLHAPSPSVETSSHLFLANMQVQLVWRHFARLFRVTLPHTLDIARFLLHWKHSTPFTHKAHMLFIVPCIILWFIWTARNDCKHRNKSFLAPSIIWNVSHYLDMLCWGRKFKRTHWLGIS